MDVGVCFVCFWFEVAAFISLEHHKPFNKVVLNVLVMILWRAILDTLRMRSALWFMTVAKLQIMKRQWSDFMAWGVTTT